MNITREKIVSAFRTNNTDKLHLHAYDGMYYELFSTMPHLSKLLEIGVLKGESISAWLDLFPESEIVGVDINLSRLTHEKARKARLVEHDATSGTIRDVITDTFNIIIDDGSHLPIDQWTAFLVLEGKWTDYYVIEDVIGQQHVDMLSKYLSKKNYKFKVYPSKKRDAKYKMNKQDVIIQFFAMVVYPKK